MNLQERMEILVRLGLYLQTTDETLAEAKEKATAENAWFIPEFVDLSINHIASQYLQEKALQDLVSRYAIREENLNPKKIGIVMAGNIPLVGFHDLLCCFITGHFAHIKLSSKDSVLMKFILQKMREWTEAVGPYFTQSELLKNCDAYIATGSNNSAGYFQYYFNKYPHIIRKNRTSVAVLTGDETASQLEELANDVYQYFGLGCRNVTKLYVPAGYNFEQLLNVFKKYDYLANHNKYKNNYDYNLAIHLLNKQYYMSNESLLLVENTSPFSPISQLHYEYYTVLDDVYKNLANNADIQCTVSADKISFGKAQQPGSCDYADGVDTMKFLLEL